MLLEKEKNVINLPKLPRGHKNKIKKRLNSSFSAFEQSLALLGRPEKRSPVEARKICNVHWTQINMATSHPFPTDKHLYTSSQFCDRYMSLRLLFCLFQRNIKFQNKTLDPLSAFSLHKFGPRRQAGQKGRGREGGGELKRRPEERLRLIGSVCRDSLVVQSRPRHPLLSVFDLAQIE